MSFLTNGLSISIKEAPYPMAAGLRTGTVRLPGGSIATAVRLIKLTFPSNFAKRRAAMRWAWVARGSLQSAH